MYIYWSGLPFPSPGYLPDPGVEPRSPALQADSLPSEASGKPFLAFLFFLLQAQERWSNPACGGGTSGKPSFTLRKMSLTTGSPERLTKLRWGSNHNVQSVHTMV